MGTILNRSTFTSRSTSGGSSGLFTYTFYTTITETIDQMSNTSMLTAKLSFKADTTGKLFDGSGFTATIQYSFDQTNWTKIASATRTSYTGTSEVTLISGSSFAIKHDDDGKKTIYYRVVITNNGNNYAPRSTSHDWTLVLENIPRGNSFSLDKTMLSKGESVVLTIAKSIDTYSSTINWSRSDGASGQIMIKDASTSKTITYEELADGLPTGVSAIIILTCETWNGFEYIASTTLEIRLSSGYMALSLYDDNNGDVGTTIGERAIGGGFNVLIDATFGSTSKKVNMNVGNSFSIGKFETLWSQSVPSTFAPTTINVDLSKFEAIIIVTSTGGYFNFSLTTRINGQWQETTHRTKVTEQQGGRMVARYFGISDSGVEVGNGYRFNTYGSSTSTTDNAMVMPVAIIGVH